MPPPRVSSFSKLKRSISFFPSDIAQKTNPEAPLFPGGALFVTAPCRDFRRTTGIFPRKNFSLFRTMPAMRFYMIPTKQRRFLQLLYIYLTAELSFYRKILDKLKNVDVCALAFSALGFLQSLSPISRTSAFRVLRRRSLQARAA